jgi:hypothetical protein
VFLFRSGALGLHGSDPPRTTLNAPVRGHSEYVLFSLNPHARRFVAARLYNNFTQQSTPMSTPCVWTVGPRGQLGLLRASCPLGVCLELIRPSLLRLRFGSR